MIDALDHLTLRASFVDGAVSAYETLLYQAMHGIHTLFPRWDSVEATWEIVQSVLDHPTAVIRYEPGTWGPMQADELVRRSGGWRNPRPMS